jgi:ATP-binding cassette subfamily F protein 3
MLGSFLFGGDAVDKKAKVLSGGERNRLALCKMLLQPFNVLVMDEPTNHLDIKSKNVLKEALKNFDGTLILVSHDRDFLQGLSNTVYEFKNKKIREYLGDINFYLEEKRINDLRDLEKKDKQEKIASDTKETAKQSYQDQKKLKSLSNKLSNIESKINKLEREIKEIDVELAINYDQTIAQPNFFDSYQAKKDLLSSLMEDWETLQEEMDVLDDA